MYKYKLNKYLIKLSRLNMIGGTIIEGNQNIENYCNTNMKETNITNLIIKIENKKNEFDYLKNIENIPMIILDHTNFEKELENINKCENKKIVLLCSSKHNPSQTLENVKNDDENIDNMHLKIMKIFNKFTELKSEILIIHISNNIEKYIKLENENIKVKNIIYLDNEYFIYDKDTWISKRNEDSIGDNFIYTIKEQIPMYMINLFNLCGANRLKQITGTCWINSVLNIFILNLELRNIILKKWDLYEKLNPLETDYIKNLDYEKMVKSLCPKPSNTLIYYYFLFYNTIVKNKKIKLEKINIIDDLKESLFNYYKFPVDETLPDGTEIRLDGRNPRYLIDDIFSKIFTKDEYLFINGINYSELYKENGEIKMDTIKLPDIIYVDKIAYLKKEDGITDNLDKNIGREYTIIPYANNKLLDWYNKKPLNNIKINTTNYKLVGATLFVELHVTKKIKKTSKTTIYQHEVACFICNGKEYIYDSNGIIVESNWTNNNFITYLTYLNKIERPNNTSTKNNSWIHKYTRLLVYVKTE